MENQDKGQIPAKEQETGKVAGKVSSSNGIERVRRARERYSRKQCASGTAGKRYIITCSLLCAAIAMVLTVEKSGQVSAASGTVPLIEAFPGESEDFPGGVQDDGPPLSTDTPQLSGPPQAPAAVQSSGMGQSSGLLHPEETSGSGEVHTENHYTLLGTFELTGYCSCDKCCGVKEQKLTKSETVPRSSYTVAVDPDVIPLGTRIMIDGVIYYAEDVGKAIRGEIVDIYFDTHEEALEFGRQQKKVYLVE